MINNQTENFEHYRPVLFRLAYGMLGRVEPAEDAVQETFLRWEKQDVDQIRAHRAWLSKVVSRICLDEIKSAKNQREQYIGPNLPEPLLVSEVKSPEEQAELAESLSMALLIVLEQLTPIQRAVFLLREVFDYDYASIADVIHKPEPTCRKIAQRARDLVHDSQPKFEGNPKEHHELVRSFLEAAKNGDMSEMESMLAREAVLYSDGGDKVTAARKPVFGAAKIAKFMVGIQKGVTQKIHLEFRDINGEPGIIFFLDGELYNVWSFHIEEGRIRSIYIVLNPDKLEHLK